MLGFWNHVRSGQPVYLKNSRNKYLGLFNYGNSISDFDRIQFEGNKETKDVFCELRFHENTHMMNGITIQTSDASGYPQKYLHM